jgi:hypothetical protein
VKFHDIGIVAGTYGKTSGGVAHFRSKNLRFKIFYFISFFTAEKKKAFIARKGDIGKFERLSSKQKNSCS